MVHSGLAGGGAHTMQCVVGRLQHVYMCTGNGCDDTCYHTCQLVTVERQLCQVGEVAHALGNAACGSHHHTITTPSADGHTKYHPTPVHEYEWCIMG